LLPPNTFGHFEIFLVVNWTARPTQQDLTRPDQRKKKIDPWTSARRDQQKTAGCQTLVSSFIAQNRPKTFSILSFCFILTLTGIFYDCYQAKLGCQSAYAPNLTKIDLTV
jgi:hypothetical protein